MQRRTKRTPRSNSNHNFIASSPISTSNRLVALTKPVRCTVPRYLQLLPDEFDCWGKVNLQSTFTGGLSLALSHKFNAPYHLFGSQVNWAGAFAANVAAGSEYLISSNLATGAAAPYSTCTVLDCEVELELVGFGGGTTATAMAAIIPSVNPSFAGVGLTQLRETPGVATMYVPPVSMAPLSLRNNFSSADIFGVSRTEVIQDPAFGALIGVDPLQLGYCHIVLSSIDGATNIAVAYSITFRLHMLFRKRNNYATAVPA